MRASERENVRETREREREGDIVLIAVCGGKKQLQMEASEEERVPFVCVVEGHGFLRSEHLFACSKQLRIEKGTAAATAATATQLYIALEILRNFAYNSIEANAVQQFSKTVAMAYTNTLTCRCRS